jgi:hypothetical protein
MTIAHPHIQQKLKQACSQGLAGGTRIVIRKPVWADQSFSSYMNFYKRFDVFPEL